MLYISAGEHNTGPHTLTNTSFFFLFFFNQKVNYPEFVSCYLHDAQHI